MLRENWAGVKEKKLREQVLPALSRLAKRAHEQGKPFLLECCQGCDQVMDQLICCGIDARGGFWDSETPIEEALGKWWGKSALFGGLDSQFLTTNGPKTIQHRCRRLMEDTGNKGYAIGVSEIPGQQITYCAVGSGSGSIMACYLGDTLLIGAGPQRTETQGKRY